MAIGFNEVQSKFLIDDSTVYVIFPHSFHFSPPSNKHIYIYASLERVIKNCAVSNVLYRCINIYISYAYSSLSLSLALAIIRGAANLSI